MLNVVAPWKNIFESLLKQPGSGLLSKSSSLAAAFGGIKFLTIVATVDKLQQTLAQLNLFRVFNTKSGCLNEVHLLYSITIWPNLELNTGPEQNLGSLPFGQSPFKSDVNVQQTDLRGISTVAEQTTHNPKFKGSKPVNFWPGENSQKVCWNTLAYFKCPSIKR